VGARVGLGRAGEPVEGLVREVPIGVDDAEAFDEDVEPVPGVTVLRVGGHFDASAVFSTVAVRVERELSRGRPVWDERPGVSTLLR
jgi:hypothetical protein